ncbi:hypothetical protein OEV98_09085 [Caldibacillus lycopersici]|uniref:DUF3939 domain-containing protein n=1 Tax=Perspicuibacillus lycopersici TaxID=1325689 RepID=A0AAE3IUM5_9BACI|nr:hypothetical protein [Perspicuibacillus lycopersici]MCU9613714.1 hypothetical protein [Perspicuibacillus lycopersici]
MKRIFSCCMVICLSLLLSGCLYPETEGAERIPYEEQVQQVQEAINQYREDNDGILPIKNKEADTDIYIKYLIDFKRLVPMYLPETPANAFENGGVFQYVILDAETNPTVKIFDLRIAETIRDIKLRLASKEYPPFKERIAPNVFSLDFKDLGYKEDPTVISPYTNQNLSFVITGDGDIYVDYQSDLYTLIKDMESIPFKQGDDIRLLLTEQSDFVPAYSLPYTIDDNGEPIFLTEKQN